MEGQPIWVVVDVHEGHSVIDGLESHGMAVTKRVLRAGDYLLGAGTVVERKTVRDLHLTLLGGRLWAQVGMIRKYPRPYLLVEGRDLDSGPASPTSVRGALLAAMDLGVRLVRTDGTDDSADWLYLLARRRQRSRKRGRPTYAQRRKTRSVEQSGAALLAAVPGISVKTAHALLERFGSVRGVLAATPEEWQGVRGLGPTRASWLQSAINHELTSDPRQL